HRCIAHCNPEVSITGQFQIVTQPYQAWDSHHFLLGKANYEAEEDREDGEAKEKYDGWNEDGGEKDFFRPGDAAGGWLYDVYSGFHGSRSCVASVHAGA